jgi:lysophospholipase
MDSKIDRRDRPNWLKISDWAAPDGWVMRSFQVMPDPDVRPRGSLLFQAGRADFIEKYIEACDHWRQRGWTIEGFDWRGQGGSGRLLKDHRLGHCAPYDVMVGDLGAYLEDWHIRSPGPHVAIGHSMGGHLLLRLMAERSPPLDGAVLLSPMLGLNTGPLPENIGRLIARIFCRAGFAERSAWSEKSGKGSGHRQRNLTHSADRYEDEQWWRRHDPMLDIGPPTWGWLRDSWQSIAGLFRPGVLEQIRTPALLLCAETDPLVITSAVKRAAQRLPNAKIRCNAEASHELLREVDPIRLWALAEIDGFLEQVGRPI